MLATPVLAHGGLNAGAVNVATLLVVAAIVVLAWWRIVRRRTRDGGRPGWLKLLPALAGVLVLGAVVTPTFVRTTPSKKRPNSTARLEILSPAQGSSEPAKVRVRLALHGGKLAALDAPIPSKLPANKGHIHIYVDGTIRMVPGLEDNVDLLPGPHTIRVEYVAIDHAPFANPPVAAVVFTVT